MQINLQSILVPVRQKFILLGGAFSDDKAGEERFIAVAAVTLGVLVVAGFALLMSMV